MKIFIFVFVFLYSFKSSSNELLASTKWAINENEYNVTVNYEIKQGMPLRVLKIFNENGDEIVGQFEIYDYFLSAFTLRDADACLITLWGAGSAYKVKVFYQLNGKFQMVLDVGAKEPPQIVSTELCPRIVLEEKEYTWIGNSYSSEM